MLTMKGWCGFGAFVVGPEHQREWTMAAPLSKRLSASEK